MGLFNKLECRKCGETFASDAHSELCGVCDIGYVQDADQYNKHLKESGQGKLYYHQSDEDNFGIER